MTNGFYGRRRMPIDGPDAGMLTLLGHDLRAAMSDIVGGLRLIDQDGFDPVTRLQMERVRAASETLARLLEDGLSLIIGDDGLSAEGRGAEPGGDFDPGTLLLDRFLYDIEMRWSGRASERGLGFRLTRSDALPEWIAVDRVALERLLSNILSNAMKYTDTGEVRLDVQLQPSGALTLACTDQGPGFSDEALARLFEFKGRPRGNGKPGEGLGMHIARDMTGRLGGTVSVENLAGGGARVTLELPSGSWSAAAPAADPALPSFAGMHLLVAEDNPTNQTIMSQMLARLGATCRIVSDGLEALEVLASERFDIALIDIEMPRLGGIEVIHACRERETSGAPMPLVAVTAYVLRANRDAIYAAGADAILAKPLGSLQHFAAAIENAVRRAHGAGKQASMRAGAQAGPKAGQSAGAKTPPGAGGSPGPASAPGSGVSHRLMRVTMPPAARGSRNSTGRPSTGSSRSPTKRRPIRSCRG